MSKKSLFIRFILIICISVLLAGCTININVGNPSDASKNGTTPNHNSDTSTNISIYQSRATIYISNKGSAESPAISSSDLIVSKDFIESYIVILNSKQIQSKIREKYPSAEYTLTLEPMNETNVFSIIAASENPECLEEICDIATSMLCEIIPQVIEGVSCKVVDHAKPAQLVEKN